MKKIITKIKKGFSLAEMIIVMLIVSLVLAISAPMIAKREEAIMKSDVPTGSIIMWNGATTAIPAGWNLCDGTNGTPDLRNRFIIGAGDSYGVGVTGGVESVTLTANQSGLRAHSHLASQDSHQHFIANTNRQYPGTINITINASNYLSGSSYAGNTEEKYSLNGDGTYPSVGLTSASRPNISITDNTASNALEAHTNMPPYYALCYIMFLGH